MIDAGWENRTPDHSLENCYFAIKLIPLDNARGEPPIRHRSKKAKGLKPHLPSC